jgi:hypothetical protein
LWREIARDIAQQHRAEGGPRRRKFRVIQGDLFG